MAQPSHQTQDKKTGKERRQYPRYPINLNAQIISSGRGSRAGVLKDYCIGGMYVQLISMELLGGARSEYQPRMGDSLEVLTTIQLQGKEMQLRFKCKVMRTDGSFLGLAFQAPDLAAIQTLHKFATSQQKSAVGGETEEYTQTEFNGKTAEQIITGAHQLIAEQIQPLLTQFHDTLGNSFMKAASSNLDMAKQNALFEAVDILGKNRDKFDRTFLRIHQLKVSEYKAGEAFYQDKNEKEEFSLEELSLVESDELDHWLSITSIINGVDAACREALAKVERRASALYRTKITKNSNPFGPVVFAYVFKDVIHELGMKLAAELVCFKTFRDALLNAAESMYNKLNDYFIENDVLPKLKYSVKRVAGSASSGAGGVEEELQELFEDNPDEENVAQQAALTPGQGQPVTSRVNSAQSRPGQQPSELGPMPGRQAVTTMHAPVNPSQDLYDVVSQLQNLQQQLGSMHTAPDGQYIPGPATQMPNLPAFDTNELLEALSNQQLANFDFSVAAAEQSLKNRIMQVLAAKYGGEVNKIIGEKENRVIDVATNVFSALLADMQLAASIRPWVKQLEIPILKMGLINSAVFLDPNNIVRKVINKLAELEVLAETEDTEDRQAITRAFEWLIQTINKEFDGTEKVFARAAQQLDILVKIQQQKFEKNIKQAVEEFIQEDQQIPEEQAQAEQAAHQSSDDEWERKVSRLEEGDWVLFEPYSETPIRLKVGWVAKHKGKYVFVNVLGKKEKVIKLEELIQLFKNGDAIGLDNADDPAMDRAQYSMLQKLHQQLLFQSSHDQLTGLVNRKEFENNLAQAIDDARFSAGKHALCYIDLDKFNVINNSCGYEGGDALLKQLAGLLKKHIGEHSVLARLGGDEFCMLLCGHSMDQALEVVEEQLAELDDFRFEWEDKRLSVAMSIGLVSITGQGQTPSGLLQAAESSCGVAKEMGGHRVQVYHEGHARLSKRHAQMEWAGKIDKALDEENLHLRCQRIMPLNDEDTYHDHYEILLGMTDELGQQSSLQEFIRAAETYKRMSELDRWVIKNAFKWIADNRPKLDHVTSFSINLSGHSLNDQNLMSFVIEQMRKTNVPIGKICFEITETLGIANLSDAADFIKRFKKTGCMFSLDDFGSGMSSYGYLKSLPVDFLKIDGVFVKDMANSPNDYAVVKSICEIGHFMGKKVIAEYVQDDETIQLLKDIGVDYAQGYGIEKPHSLDMLIR